MKVLQQKFGRGARLCSVMTDKFKRNLLIMTYMLPIDPKTTAMDQLLPSVLLRGCEKYPSNALVKRRCEQLYGASLEYYFSYFGDDLMINICADFLVDSAVNTRGEILSGVVELMADIWRAPIVDEDGCLSRETVKKAKAMVCDSLRAADNDTAAYASRRCREIICCGTPAGYSASVEDVESITAEGLTERYRQVTASCRAEFFYVGSEQPETVIEALDKYFGGVDFAEIGPLHVSPLGALNKARSQTEVLPVGQAKLTVGMTCGSVIGDGNYYANAVAVEVFGGSPISKLFVNVRERLGLCYYCAASYSKTKGIVYVSSGIDTEDRTAVEGEIIAQLEQMKQGNITEQELMAAKLSIVNSVRQITDRPYSIWSFCNSRRLLGLDTDISRHIEQIENVTADDIRRVCSTWQIGSLFFIEGRGSGGEYED